MVILGKRYKRNDVRKTIRFDEEMYSRINSFAVINGESFSSIAKLFLTDSLNRGEDKALQAQLTKEDKGILDSVYSLYSGLSNNLNQSAHALNSIKGLSFLDLEPDLLDRKLNYISNQLESVNSYFSDYQDTLNDFIDHVRRRRNR